MHVYMLERWLVIEGGIIYLTSSAFKVYLALLLRVNSVVYSKTVNMFFSKHPVPVNCTRMIHLLSLHSLSIDKSIIAILAKGLFPSHHPGSYSVDYSMVVSCTDNSVHRLVVIGRPTVQFTASIPLLPSLYNQHLLGKEN